MRFLRRRRNGRVSNVSADYLTCQELVELVTEYLEGALSVRDRERFEEHLMTCPCCQAHLTQVQETIRITGHVSEEALSKEAERDLLEAFRGWKRGG